MSTDVLQLLYLTPDCSGPPSIGYQQATVDVELSTCGLRGRLASTAGHCCVSFLNSAIMPPFGSYSFISPKQDSQQEFPFGALGTKYCQLDLSSYNYSKAFIQETGTCIDQFVCTSGGKLQVYANLGCTGDVEQIEPGKSSISKILTGASMLFNIITIANPTKSVSWKTYAPPNMLVPNFTYSMEVIGLLCFIASLILSVAFAILKALELLVEKNKRTLLQYGLFGIHVLWIIKTCLHLSVWVSKVDLESTAIMVQIHGMFENMATLTSVILITYAFVFQIFKLDKFYQYLLVGGISVLHISLAGAKYMYYLISGRLPNEAVNAWKGALPYWIAFMYIWMNIPVIIVANVVLDKKYKTRTYIDRLSLLWKKFPDILIIFTLQIITFIIYFTAVSVMEYSSLLADDRNYLGLWGVQNLALVTPSVLTSILAKRFKDIWSAEKTLSTLPTGRTNHNGNKPTSPTESTTQRLSQPM